jgi:DNA invertase Pin-like site-specific DNA recombinase
MKPTAPAVRKLRCAVYTRKSTEEGLDQEFNTLQAQREACEAYVQSQKAEGWLLVSDRYDDGGYSGGNLDRPALKRLMLDIEARKVDIVVVYKIDRLSRSLMDFAKLVEIFEKNEVTFVSITQSFSTTTSMGRLTLNVLLSFAQFEREVIGERIRDKVAASRRKGMWMGGWAPLGYDVKNRKLIINDAEAALVQSIFKQFAQGIQPQLLLRKLSESGALNKNGKPIDKGYLYRVINNRVYLGEAVHKGQAYPGEHEAIIAQDLWDQAHGQIATTPQAKRKRQLTRSPALLRGLIFAADGSAMTPSHTRRGGRLYRYYADMSLIKTGRSNNPVKRIPAAQIETAVVGQIRSLLHSPEIIVATWRKARQEIKDLKEREVAEQLRQFERIWAELFPIEQERIIHLLVERIEVTGDGANITLRTEGLSTVFQEMRANCAPQAA